MNNKTKNILSIISIMMLLLAIPDVWPYFYFQLLRWVVCGIAIFNIFFSHEIGKRYWPWVMGVVAILFNPILPFYLDKGMWVFIDIVVAIVTSVFVFKIKK